jgi:hypothetical protein
MFLMFRFLGYENRVLPCGFEEISGLPECWPCLLKMVNGKVVGVTESGAALLTKQGCLP